MLSLTARRPRMARRLQAYPKLQLEQPLSVRHSMTLGPNPFKHGYPPALLVPLVVRPGANVRSRPLCGGGGGGGGGGGSGGGGGQSQALQRALGLHSALEVIIRS